MREKNIFNILFCLCISYMTFLVGCATPAARLHEIRLGEPKNQIIETLGAPTVARGSIRNKYGEIVEVYEYRLALPPDDSPGEVLGKSALTFFTLGLAAGTFRGERRDYWLYFVNDVLVQWGEAGDWAREADRIYEVRFGSSNALE